MRSRSPAPATRHAPDPARGAPAVLGLRRPPPPSAGTAAAAAAATASPSTAVNDDVDASLLPGGDGGRGTGGRTSSSTLRTTPLSPLAAPILTSLVPRTLRLLPPPTLLLLLPAIERCAWRGLLLLLPTTRAPLLLRVHVRSELIRALDLKARQLTRIFAVSEETMGKKVRRRRPCRGLETKDAFHEIE